MTTLYTNMWYNEMCYKGAALYSDIYKGLDKRNFERKIVYIFLPISFNIHFGCSKEQSH